MKIFVKAKPGAKEEKVEKIGALFGQDKYVVSVKEPPIQGRANAAIIRVLAEYFGTSPSKVKIISGFASREKAVEILK